MRTEKIERELRAANPVAKQTLAALDLSASEVALGETILSEFTAAGESIAPDSGSRRRRSVWLLTAMAATATAAAALVILVAGTGSRSTTPAYGAELVRFAESTPLLLLEGPDWRVDSVAQTGEGLYMARSSRGTGSMEFVTGPPIANEIARISADGSVSRMAPKADRQRKVELSWRSPQGLRFPGPTFPRPIRLPVLDTTALVNTRAETAYIETKAWKKRIDWGGPGDREMAAIWKEDGYIVEMRAWVSNKAAFEERLGWLSRVDSETWLNAMPPSVVKAADHDAAVRVMLKGIPVPEGFSASQIPDEGLTTNRDQVAGLVTGIVSCQWFRQWGEARRTGDRAAEAEAEEAMATSKHWPILREMAKDGGYSPLVWQLAAAMPSGMWERGPHRWRLLPKAEALGCARWGIPVLPWKQRRQRQRRDLQSP
jgi:hypothetical protein